MQIIIHRGSHQIGGIATEIRTASTRILIDMGDELGMESDFISKPLSIRGVTDSNSTCDAVLFTHYHGDHIGQMMNVRKDIPLFMGSLAKEIILATIKDKDCLKLLVEKANTFLPGKVLQIGDIFVTPFSVDHSACDSYMFLIEADEKRVLYTGDFRLHGFRGKAIPKIIDKFIGKVDVLITEGTTLSRNPEKLMTEGQLQKKVKDYMKQYKYVFVLCSSTNLERICALSKAVPKGKYFICDGYQSKLLDIIQHHWGKYSSLYRNIKKTTYGDNLLSEFQNRGFLMVVRNNHKFQDILSKFDGKKSIILYSMWDGYRTKQGSTIPDFLNTFQNWQPLHTSGHASTEDLLLIIEKTQPEMVIPIHTSNPESLRKLCPDQNIKIAEDGDEICL